MESSKNNAIQVAYSRAGKFVDSNYKGVYVLDVYPDMPAAKVLKPGDRITKMTVILLNHLRNLLIMYKRNKSLIRLRLHLLGREKKKIQLFN